MYDYPCDMDELFVLSDCWPVAVSCGIHSKVEELDTQTG